MDERWFFLKFLSFIAIISLIGACKKSADPTDDDANPVMIRYNDHELTRSELSEQAQQTFSPKDSIQLVNNFIEKWLKDQIMVKEARKQLTNQDEINQLTEKFRDELLQLKFEEKILREKLDTTISEQELLEYYRSNKAKYKLESTIFRFVLLKINKPVAESKTLENLWKNINQVNLQLLNLYCQNNADICYLNPQKWYKWDEVKQHLPSKFISENTIQSGITRDFADFNHSYRVRFYEVVRPNQEPPLSFFKDQATQAIFHQRKIKLLEKIKNELYESELKNKHIQFLNK
ncbi:MAG: hypothetical protein IPK91_09315 [Saprospiraceae bacterium]|nr:hypothetical protein [Saprospiraceae bacterium]MBK8297456.1 hypothetical protein [Saprospiraceae bacterium]